jgi:hypothetical protein
MKLPAKASKRTRPHQCGIPVDVKVKARLRDRSMPLTNDQRAVLKSMGIKPDKKVNGKKVPLTEKEAANLCKRVITGATNYKNGVSNLTRKKKLAKPKRVTKRQHNVSILLNRDSNRAAKMLERV